MEHVNEILSVMVKKGASDLHLGVGRPPFFRIDGDLMPSDFDPLTDDDMDRLAKQLLTPKREYRLEEENEIDFAYSLLEKDVKGRFRVNIFRQKGGLAAALRLVSDVIPSF